MSSGLSFPGGNNNGNEDDFQSSPALIMGGQEGSPSMTDNQLMSDMMGKNNLEIDITRVGDEEIDSDDVRSKDEQINNSGNVRSKKRYHRHTQYQIQELENSFKSCPHPDDKQRKTLSRDLDLEPLQVKFWFQNKRTQMKMKHERYENSQLRSENERILAENIRLRTTVGNAACTACGGPTAIGDHSFDEHYLCMENLRLKDEINQMSGLAEKCVGKPRPWAPKFDASEDRAGSQLLAPGQLVRQMVRPMLEVEKHVIAEMACSAMNELIGMTQIVEPMWIPVLIDRNTTYMLNEDEYFHGFLRAPAPRSPGFRWEATRDSTIVKMNPINFIGILMNVNQWASLFCGIVAKAIPLELLSAGAAGSYDGALQLLNAEFQMLSPLVPTRETYMARFCKKQCEGIWAVVDFSLDVLNANQMMKFQKRPSGCLVQQLENGYSKITWIEHVEVEDRGYNVMYRPMIISGAAFGAMHWLSVLNWQCERFSCCNVIIELPPNDVNNFRKKCMLKLADRMVIGFCTKVGASSLNPWTTLSRSGNDEIKVMTHQSVNEQGGTYGIAICVATSIWLPVVPKKVFAFFCDVNHRAKWDVLTKGANIIKIGHVTTGEQPGNGIVLLRVNATPENPNNMLILQESYVNRMGCFIVFAPIDLDGMNQIFYGGDSNEISLYPSGFTILPDGSGSGGSLVTLAFQILVDFDTDPTLSLSDVAAVNNLMTGTVERVRRFFEVNADL